MALTRKELLAVLKDPRAASAFCAPDPAMPDLRLCGDVRSQRRAYAVLDQDRSSASRTSVAGLDGSGVFRRVANLDHAAELKTAIDRGRDLIVIQIDQDFERRLLSGQPAECRSSPTAATPTPAGTALGYVGTIVAAYNADWRAAHAWLSAQRGECRSVQVTTRAWFNPNLETRWHMIPSLIGMLTLLQTLLFTAMSVAREREQGTFDQLLVTPVSARRNHGRQGVAIGADRAGPGDQRTAGGAALVSHSFRGIIR